MPNVLTRISIVGFTEDEVTTGLPELLDEFQQRPWLLNTVAAWDPKRSRLVVSVEREGEDVSLDGGCGGANRDEVWDCVIACINFSADEISFDVEESKVIPSSGDA
ncbi:MAG: hypothetical protein K8T25_13235 [Planctomycetia bacterium]|nr:hypothetical protein [Planctomycetia bacterium]